MRIPEQLRFSLDGFSGKRVGSVLAVVSFALVPTHFYASCEESGAVAAIGLTLFFFTGFLSFLVPRGTPHRFQPFAFAFLALVGHMLCAH
jgi:hypothetical protein